MHMFKICLPSKHLLILVDAECKLLKNPKYGKEMEESKLEYEAWNNTYHVY